MTDSTTSGNRWEPTAGDAGTTATAVVDQPAPVPAYDGSLAAPAAPATPRRTVRERLRGVPRSAVVAGVAAFLVVAAAFGGFAVGRATAPDGGAPQTGFTPGDRGGVQGGFQGGPGGDRDGDGQGFPGQGQQGTFPGQQDGTAPDGATGSSS